MSRSSGTSISLLIQVRDKVLITCIGKSGAIYGFQTDDGEFAFARVENKMDLNLEVPKDDQAGVSYRAPLGFLAEDVKIYPVEAALTSPTQFVAVTTSQIPEIQKNSERYVRP
jgi:hypothetical protein